MPNFFANVLSQVRNESESAPSPSVAAAIATLLDAPTSEPASPSAAAQTEMQAALGDNSLYGLTQLTYTYFSSLYGLNSWPWEGLDSVALRVPKKEPCEPVEAPSREMLKRVEPLDRDEIAAIDLEDEDRKLALEAEAVLGYRVLREKMQMPGLLRRTLDQLDIPVLDQASVDAYKKQMVAHYETTGKMQMPTWRLTRLEDYKQEIPKFALRKAAQIKRALPEAEIYIDQLGVDPFLIVSFGLIEDYLINRSTRDLEPETQAYIEVWAEPRFEATL